jgi:hypothetical protein
LQPGETYTFKFSNVGEFNWFTYPDILTGKISATVGPTVTLYEIIPAAGVRISRIKNLEDDIALSLAALGIRIIAPIPGKGTIGIEVPNARKTIVSMKTLLSSDKFSKNSFSLPIAIGKKIDNENFETIEGNTSIKNDSNGGSVMRRSTRKYSNAIFIHPKL